MDKEQDILSFMKLLLTVRGDGSPQAEDRLDELLRASIHRYEMKKATQIIELKKSL